MSCVIAVQLNACGDVVEPPGVQDEAVLPNVATTAADAPVPPPKVALRGIPPFPPVHDAGPSNPVMSGLLTVTVAGAVAVVPAWLVTVRVKTVVACRAFVVAVSVLVATLALAMPAAGPMVNVQPVQTVPVSVVVPPGLIGFVPFTLKAMVPDGFSATFTSVVAVVVELAPVPSVTVSV